MRFRCPVCMFPGLPYPPRDYHICPCCSTEFGNDDAAFSHQQLREMWIGDGPHWFFGKPPDHWNAWAQLLVAGYLEYFPKEQVQVAVNAGTEIRTVFLPQPDLGAIHVHG